MDFQLQGGETIRICDECSKRMAMKIEMNFICFHCWKLFDLCKECINNDEISKVLCPEHCLLTIPKIISGGQSGADIAALRAAKKLNLETGGFAPKNFQTVDGSKPELGTIYGLTEIKVNDCISLPSQYVIRSKLNVEHSDGTLAFRSRYSPGTDKTIGYAISKQWKSYNDPSIKGSIHHPWKPVLIIDLLRKKKY